MFILFFRKRPARKGHLFLKKSHLVTIFSTYSPGYVFDSWLFSQSTWNRCSCLKTLLYLFFMEFFTFSQFMSVL